MPLYFHRGEKVVPVGMQLFRETWPHQMARILLMKATKEGCFACCEKVSLQFCFPGEDLGKLPIALLHWYWKSGGVFYNSGNYIYYKHQHRDLSHRGGQDKHKTDAIKSFDNLMREVVILGRVL